MNEWEKAMAKDASTSYSKMSNDEYVVKYLTTGDACGNYMRVQTRWERIIDKLSNAWCAIKTPFIKGYSLLMYSMSGIRRFISIRISFAEFYDKSVELDLLSKEVEKYQQENNDLKSENDVLRYWSNKTFMDCMRKDIDAAQKKKAAKKRPSNKKKRKG